MPLPGDKRLADLKGIAVEITVDEVQDGYSKGDLHFHIWNPVTMTSVSVFLDVKDVLEPGHAHIKILGTGLEEMFGADFKF